MVKLFEQKNASGQLQFEPNKVKNERDNSLEEDQQQEGREFSDENIDFELVKQVRELLKHEYDQNSNENSNKNVNENENIEKYSKIHYDQIMDERYYQTCWRYLLENNLNLQDTFEQIKRNLIWRQTNRIDLLSKKDFCKDFFLKAPIGFTGKTLDGHDLAWLVGKNYKKPDGKEAKLVMKSIVTTIIIDWDRKNQNNLDKFVLVVDVSSTTFRNLDLEFAAWLISLRDYFPSRVKSIYIAGIPYLMRPIIRLIISWLPDKYRQITHCPALEALWQNDGSGNNNEAIVTIDQVPQESGGQAKDNWRLTTLEVPWASELNDDDRFSLELMQQINSSICFNTSAERLEQLYEMQRDFDEQQRKLQQQQQQQ